MQGGTKMSRSSRLQLAPPLPRRRLHRLQATTVVRCAELALRDTLHRLQATTVVRCAELALRDTRTPRHSHSETLALRDTRTPRHSHSETLALRDTRTPRHSHSATLALRDTRMLKVSHPVMQSLLKIDIATHYHGPRHPNILAFPYLFWLFQTSALSQHNPMYHSH